MNGAELQEIREGLGLSQTDAALRVGYSQAQWSRWEKGSEIPPLVLWVLKNAHIRKRLLVEGELVGGVKTKPPDPHPGCTKCQICRRWLPRDDIRYRVEETAESDMCARCAGNPDGWPGWRQWKPCPHCNAPSHPDYTTCTGCGRSLSTRAGGIIVENPAESAQGNGSPTGPLGGEAIEYRRRSDTDGRQQGEGTSVPRD